MNRFKKTLSIITLIALGFLYIPHFVYADSATLYLTPSSVSQQVGSNFTIYVGVNSGGNAVNAIEGTVNLPSSVLTVNGAGTGGSICSMWVQSPAVNGSSVSFKCGIPSGSTAGGTLISISVTAKAVGSGTASISAARVLAGPGTNVTGGASGGTYTVTEAATSGGGGGSTGGNSGGGTTRTPTTSAPSISSGSHPDQNAWYTNSSPLFTWTKGGSTKGFSYVFDQDTGTVPGTTVNSADTSVGFSDKADGTYYFHIRASGTAGWSGTTHYKVQIDKTAPTGLTIVTEPKVEADKRPMVSFNATDATSGIAYYEIKMDGGEFARKDSPYTPESIKSGDHVFTVRAFDRAGNMVEDTAKIKIKDIPIPTIVSPANNSILKLAQKLSISGKADPYTKIDLYFDGVNIARGLAVTEDGVWKYEYNSFIMPGKHQIFAIAVKDGIESQPSAKTNLRIDPSAINLFGVIVPIYFVIIFLIIIIVILLALLLWFFIFVKRKYDTVKERLRERNKETERIVHNEFDQLETHIRKDVQRTYEAKVKTPKEEHQLEAEIEKELELSEKAVEETISKEIKDL